MEKISRFLQEEDGATAVEYGVLIALIIAACIVIIQLLGAKINQAFDKVDKTLSNAGVGGS